MKRRKRYQFKRAFEKQIEKEVIRNYIDREMKANSCMKISDAFSESLYLVPLEKGASLFKKSENMQDSFLTSSRTRKSVSMPEGYINAALNLLGIIKKSNDNLVKDGYIFPALFCFRQYLELIMKESISSFEKLGGKYKDDKNHSLTDLWKGLYTYLDKEDEILPIVEELISEFDNKDRNSMTFRYPYQKDKQGKIKQETSFNDLIDIENLRTKMLQLYRFFDNINALACDAEFSNG